MTFAIDRSVEGLGWRKRSRRCHGTVDHEMGHRLLRDATASDTANVGKLLGNGAHLVGHS
jgi:hypothetical protein